MHSQGTKKRITLDHWQAQQLRLTVFFTSSIDFIEQAWWSELITFPPDTEFTQVKKGVKVAEGVVEGKRLRLQIRPNRIDWWLNSSVPESPGVPTLGSFLEALDTFLELMLRWLELESIPPVGRLAFGAHLVLPVENKETGYQKLAPFLPSIQIDSEGSEDFTYRINRPRNSTLTLPDPRINRLSTWKVERWSIELDLDGQKVEVESGHMVHLELDINTAANFTQDLPRSVLPQLFQELVDLGVEIAQEGDIR